MGNTVYVTLNEAAELEGITYNAMKLRNFHDNGKIKKIQQKRENGGRDITLVAVNSLSKQARNAWRERERLKELAGDAAGLPEANRQMGRPWYVDADYEWFEHQHKKKVYEATELGNVIRRFLKEAAA
ncbi:transposase, partial [Anaerotruncus sp. 1XD22-93]